MTREEWINDLCHEMDGWLLDACLQERRGGELSIWLKIMRKRIREQASRFWNEAQTHPSKADNGQPPTSAQTKGATK